MNEISTLDTSNYEAMAKAMGMSSLAVPTKEKTNSLARLRIHHTPLMGQTEVKGKMANVEVVSGGTYKLEIPDGETYYAESIAIRPSYKGLCTSVLLKVATTHLTGLLKLSWQTIST